MKDLLTSLNVEFKVLELDQIGKSFLLDNFKIFSNPKSDLKKINEWHHILIVILTLFYESR